MIGNGRIVAFSALALALFSVQGLAQQLTILPTLIPPEETNPKLSSEDIQVDLSFNWTQEAYVQAYTGDSSNVVLWCRASRGDSISEPVQIPVVEDGELVTEARCGIISLTSGYRTVTAEVSFTEQFAEVSATDIRYRVIPGGLTLLPPLLTIILAIVTKQVHVALFSGVWFAAFLIHWYDPFRAFLRSIDTYVLESFADQSHVTVILFDWFLSGITTLLQRGGGSDGIARAVIGFAKTRRMTMFVCFLCGLLLFFDDYSNTLIVGSTFRTMFDDMLISREKLSYVVDSTSAPIASISPISSWVGYEMSLITESYDFIQSEYNVDLKAKGWDTSAFIVFVKTIPGRYYPIGMLVLQLFLILAQRDFFSMLRAERRVLHTGKIVADDADRSQTEIDDAQKMKEGVPPRWYNAVGPILTLILLVVLALIFTGIDNTEAAGDAKTVQNIFGNSEAYLALLWATFTVSIVTILFFRLQYFAPGNEKMMWIWNKSKDAVPVLGLVEGIMTWIEGIKNLVSTIMVLILAWSIGFAMTELGTDTFLASAVSESIDPRAIPALVFLISAAISCATGTSWGTMAIMFPIATKAIFQADPDDEDAMLNTIASILSGSVFGDHVSPISDTTILSSLSSRCDLMHHVRTQAPYATLVAVIATIFGDLLVGYLYPNWAGLCITVALIIVVSYAISAKVDSDKPDLTGRIAELFGHKSSVDGHYGAGNEDDDDDESKSSDAGGERGGVKGKLMGLIKGRRGSGSGSSGNGEHPSTREFNTANGASYHNGASDV